MDQELTPLEALEEIQLICDNTRYSEENSVYEECENYFNIVEKTLKDYQDEKKTSYNRLLKVGELVGQINEKDKEIEKGKKFVKIIREAYANEVGIDKVFDDIRHSDSYEDFKEKYPYCPKDWYDLLKEVLL